MSPRAAVVKAIVAVAKALWYNQRRLYHRLRCRKCTEFWRDKIEANELYPRSLWRTVDVLLGRGRIPSSLAIDVEIFCQFFDERIAKVRSHTSGAPPPIRIQLSATRNAYGTSPLTTDDVTSAVRRLPDKSSAADPIPTSVLKQIIDLVAPFIDELFNRSPSVGHCPAVFKEAFITTIVKNPGLDSTDVNSSSDIKPVCAVKVHGTPRYTPAAGGVVFLVWIPTETAVLRVLSDVLQAVDRVDLVALILLDMSTAFNTVDHLILLQRHTDVIWHR